MIWGSGSFLTSALVFFCYPENSKMSRCTLGASVRLLNWIFVGACIVELNGLPSTLKFFTFKKKQL